jgi:hypothetical protein
MIGQYKNKLRHNYLANINGEGIRASRAPTQIDCDGSFIGNIKTRNNSKIIVSEVTEHKTFKAKGNNSIDLKQYRLTPVNKDTKIDEYLKHNFAKLDEHRIKKLSKPKAYDCNVKRENSLITYLKHSKHLRDEDLLNKTTSNNNQKAGNNIIRPVTSDKLQLNTSGIGSSHNNKNSQNTSYYMFKSEDEISERTGEKINVRINFLLEFKKPC